MKQELNDQTRIEIKQFCKKYPAIRELEVIAVDISGHFFGKRYPIAKLDTFAAEGLAFTAGRA